MSYTISAHNGSAAHRDHNIRNPKVVNKENHIDRNGEFEIWKDETLSHAYHRLFDDALKEYNDKQTRADRKIKNYLSSIKNDAKKHPVYEMIVEVGAMNNRPPEDIHKAILRDFFENWTERNPNLELIGAYFHNDETGNMHIHLDYIPIAHNYTRGMSIQTSLSKALEEQGFVKIGKLTPQIQWQHSERKKLEEICNVYGLEIEHPTQERREHLNTEEYRLTKFVEELTDQAVELEKTNIKLADKNETLQQENDKLKNDIAILKGERKTQKDIQTEKLGKNFLGLKKNKVELSYEDFQTLTRFNNEYTDIERTKKEIDALKTKLEVQLKQAIQDKNTASELLKDAENIIKHKVQDEIIKAFNDVPTNRFKRLEEFVKQYSNEDGYTIFDEFLEYEKNLLNDIEKELHRTR